MKKKIIILGMMLVLVCLLSGCIDVNYAEGKLLTTKGYLIKIVDKSGYTFVFEDDVYVSLSDLGDYELSQVKEFLYEEVEIKYTDGYIKTRLIDIRKV